MKEIGGYFNLELPYIDSKLPSFKGVLLNTGRNSLEYIFRSIPRITKLYIPYYTCDTILEPICKLSLKYEFYSINNSLELCDDIHLNIDEYIVYTNYFGVKDSYCQYLEKKYSEHLIVDNAQALFAKPTMKCAYSPRKFVGLPDGGIAFSDCPFENKLEQATSYNLCSHLLKRIDCGAETGYIDFRENSALLSNCSIQSMSNLTRRLLNSIDFRLIKEVRNKNFSLLHAKLGKTNKLNFQSIDNFECPMVYPYLTSYGSSLKKYLIKNKVYIPTYWPNIKEWCNENQYEFFLMENVVAIPIDQRYTLNEMKKIISIIKHYEKSKETINARN